MKRLWAELWQRLRSLVHADAEDAELREELAFHLERAAESNRARGMSPAEALRAARRTLGNVGHGRVVASSWPRTLPARRSVTRDAPEARKSGPFGLRT